MTDQRLVTPLGEAKRFMVDCFKAVGACEEHAVTVAENLLEADYRGHYSHGMNRLDMYIKHIKGKQCKPNATCTIDRELGATAVVNGNHGFGAVVGKFCMNLAIKKARQYGLGMVVAHSSNHYGIAGMYALQAIKEGFIGFSVTNTSPFMVPTRAKEPALGTNPIALGAPALNGDSFVLDMATTAVAIGKIEVANRKGVPISEGWAVNDKGQVETDPSVAFKTAKLMPLGGGEINSGYKGYGLGLMVEILSGILSGAKYGPRVRNRILNPTALADLGHAFIAIDPKAFTPGFDTRMDDLLSYIRRMPPLDSNKPVLVPGDPERIHAEQVRKYGGLRYCQDQHDSNNRLAKELNVKPMSSIVFSHL